MVPVTEDEVVELVRRLPGVLVIAPTEADGAPEAWWSDRFFYYDPAGTLDTTRHQPFATIVTHDYEGFDTASDLDRPGVFRVNVAVGSKAFEGMFGYPPAAHADHHAEYDYAALDQVLPHPIYAGQGWVSVLSPGSSTTSKLESLLGQAHALAAERHRRRAVHD